MSKKLVSSGGLIVNDKNEILIVRGTHNKNWNIPKGVMDQNQTPYETAVRQIMEQTNIDVSDCVYKYEGLREYLPNKDLHVFIFYIGNKQCDVKCTSTFTYETRNKKYQLPEIQDFTWTSLKKARQLWSRSINNTLDDIEL